MPNVTIRSGDCSTSWAGEPQRGDKSPLGADHVVRRHHGHDRVGIVAANFERRQPDAGGRVALAGLAQDAAGGQLGQLLAISSTSRALVTISTPLGRDQVRQPIDRRLDHRPLADQLQQLLGQALTGFRARTACRRRRP